MISHLKIFPPDFRVQLSGEGDCLASCCGLRFPACFGGGSSKSESQSNPITTTNSGAGGLASGAGAVSGGEGSLNVGAGGKYQEQGSIDLTNANITDKSQTKTLTDSLDLSGSSGSTVNITDNGAVANATALAGRVVDTQSEGFKSALTALANLAGGQTNAVTTLAGQQSSDLLAILKATNEAQSANNDTVNNLVGSVLGTVKEDLATAQAGTSAALLSTIQWIVLGVAAVIGATFIFRKRHA